MTETGSQTDSQRQREETGSSRLKKGAYELNHEDWRML